MLKPIPTAGKTAADVDSLLKETHEAMLDALNDMARDSESKMASKVAEKKES